MIFMENTDIVLLDHINNKESGIWPRVLFPSDSRRLNLRACCSAAGVFLYSANGKATLSGYSRLAVPPAGKTVEARQLRDGYPGELITRKYIVAVILPAWLLSQGPSEGLRLPRCGCGRGDCRSRGIPIQIRPEGSYPPLCIQTLTHCRSLSCILPSPSGTPYRKAPPSAPAVP